MQTGFEFNREEFKIVNIKESYDQIRNTTPTNNSRLDRDAIKFLKFKCHSHLRISYKACWYCSALHAYWQFQVACQIFILWFMLFYKNFSMHSPYLFIWGSSVLLPHLLVLDPRAAWFTALVDIVIGSCLVR